MSKLYFTVGLPRCGKSTLAYKWLNKESDIKVEGYSGRLANEYECGPKTARRFFPRAVVNGDDFRMAIHGDIYHKETEGFVGAAVFAAIRALLLTGHDVLFDETNSSEWSIRRIFEINPQAVAIRVDTPLQICEERALANNQPYLIPVIQRVDRNLQKLDIEAIRSDYIS